MKKLTRFVSVLLSALMVASMFTALNFTAFAADSKLTIRANSNIFPTQTQEFDADTNQITVTWWMQVSDANMVNTQCVITYDSSKLAVDMTDGVNSTVEDGKRVDRILRVTDGVGTVTNYAPQQTYLDLHENNPSGNFLDGESDNDASIKVNSVNLEGRELTESNGKVPFVSVTFNPKDGAQGVTNVNLYVEIMQIRGEDEEEERYFIARSEIADNKVSYMPETPSAVYAGTFDDYSVQAGDVFTVAGTANFLGAEWEAKPTVNVMTKGSDGIYKITVKNVKAVSGAVYEVKVVEFKNGDQNQAIWHGVPGTGNNVDFGLKSDCDVTVTYNPSTGEIKVTGTGVTDPSYKIDYVAVVGNGTAVPSFVNGKNWDPTAAANKMTANSNVYEITYKNVASNKDLEFKFAANGAWALNWGNGSAVTLGTPMDAYDGGENIKFNYKSSKPTFDLTLKLDLTNWDADKKTGAKFTVTAKDSEEPTEAPTTAAPTTAAPTTAAPTTAAPTTAAPTTKPAGDVFTLAGSSNFLGTAWVPAPDEYVMTKGSDGNYTITVPAVKAVSGAIYEVKVVEFKDGDQNQAIWHGVPGTGNNVDFGLKSDCDVTVTYNPSTGEIKVTGAGVTEASYKIDYVTVVGNGKDVPSFVNGVEWDPAAESNKMTATGSVYEITYKGVAANKDLEFKFAANGAWALSWGNNAQVVLGTPMDAYDGGENIKFNYKSSKSTFDLTLKLDLTNWDADKKTGAKFTATAKENAEPTTAAPTTAAPTTAAPTTAAPTTKPTGDVFTLAGSSNFLDTAWEPTPDDYVMTKGGDGNYTITVPSVKAVTGAIYEVKVVEFKDGDPDKAIWHGKDGGDANVDFGLSKDCDVTVTYNPNTKAIIVTGAGVTEPSYKIDYVTVVGNGKDVPSFVNGVEWDPAAESNKMTATGSVYEITYKGVAANKDLEFKFAANGAWALSWGNNAQVVLGTPMDAFYNGENFKINYASTKATFDLTLKLDLTNWDAKTLSGAKFTATAKENAEPTTAAPTTAAPTTAAPTTVAPTTAAPTTKPSPSGDVYTLAGTSNFIDTAWEPTPDDYVMTKGSDGNYTITVKNVKAIDGAVYQVKVVQFVDGDPEKIVWHGKDGGDGNVDFGLSKDCDVTVTYNPNTKAITVTGAGVTEPSYKLDYVTAAGSGYGNFLNGVSWDPTEESNRLTMVSPDVYEITYEEVDANTDLQFKFAANGTWVLNWGYTGDVAFDTPTEAHFDGGNIIVNYESENDYFDLTLRLDLTNWDADKRTGAKFTVIAKEIEQPTTEKPEPTTAAPTTAAPTTVAPTTAAPTTKPSPSGDVYTLAGTSNFIDTAWEPTPDDYVMTKGSDGNYTITVKNVKAIDGAVYQVKVVQFVDGDPEKIIWHGKDGGDGNVDFALSKDCDVTVTYNPNTKAITVTGAGVTEPSYKLDYVTAAGSGYGNFLNGVNWDPTEESNRLTMVSPDVYEITYEEVDANTDLQFKFAANGTWVLNWGYTGDVAFDTPTEAHFDGGNIIVNYESESDYFDLTLRLDLTNWDADKRTGAKFTVIAKEIEQPTTEKPEPTTVAPTTAAPTTVAPTTVAPTTVAPTTVAPTTVAPTTVAPTTETPTTEPVHVHTIVVDKGYPATCTSTGLTDGSHCETCGEVIKAQEVIPMHPDTMVVKGYPATYEKDGLTDGVRCKRCGTWVVERQVIPKLIRYGDVNRDGEITIEDATLLQKFIAELVTFNEDQKRAADTNGDGQIRIDDVTEIQKYVAELIHELGPKQTSS